ncbi:MAG: B12-binding domain-containing radical SAM protein [Deltaproteobacteria bacterium]|nr:MAG: B12-binding domain-containing radical SAM protein [Deltaproteobacteria bacterium]
MRVELINPNNPTNAANIPFLQRGLLSRTAKAYSPPLNLSMIAAYTPPNINVSITDECVSPIDFEKDVDLVGLTAYTNSACRAYEIADAFRKRGVTVVMGGVHVSNLPGEALEHCDAVVVGEAEGAWEQLMLDFSRSQLKRVYQNNHLVSLESLPIPRRDLLTPDDYVTINTVQTTRGCPHNCSFCSVTRFNGRTYRFRPIPEVIREIESLPSRNVFVVDDNIMSNRLRTRNLFEALTPLGLRWGSQCTITIAQDPEMLELAAKSGCIGLAIGFESFCKESLKGAHKRFNSPDQYYKDIETIKSYGILIWGSFVLGFDEDDEANLEKTLWRAKRSKLDFACFNFLTPLPGTKVYEAFERDGRLTSKNWADYNMANLVFRPIRVTDKVLREKVRKAWLEFYSLKALTHRLGLSLGKIQLFIWLVNLALCFYTRKKLKWNWKARY